MPDSAPPWWSVHTHSRYSANDAMPTVIGVVERAAELGYPALGLTDHGNPSGSVQLYKACRKHHIAPGPGIELYVTSDREHRIRSNDHLTVMAYSEQGYRNLVRLSNLAAANYWYKPRVDYADFAELSEAGHLDGLMVATGCYFGTVIQALLKHGPSAAAQHVRALAGWFPKAYVELQHHGIQRQGTDLYSEDDIIDELVAISNETGVPYIITQDSHYLRPEEQHEHDGLKKLVAFGEDPSEAVFPGDPYCMVDGDWLRPRFPAEVYDQALSSITDLAECMKVRIPELDTFSLKVPDVSLRGEPQAELEVKVQEGLVTFFASEGVDRKRQPAYTKVIEQELEIIRTAGMAGYLLLVEDVCRAMDRLDIWYAARGSAAGSLVTRVLGITQADPIEDGLRFDRFLSPDRTRPPDIDLDVQDDRRDEVVAYLEQRYSVRQVGSHMQMKMTNEDDEEGAGSLLRKYYSTVFKTTGERIGWDQVPAKDRQLLKQLGVRKLISGPGTHAAGYIVAPDELTVSQLPMTWMDGRSALVTAYGKKDVEALGFCKLDLLGSTTLTAMRKTCELVAEAEERSAREIWSSIPREDTDTFRRISSGNTKGMFQLEGGSSTRGFKEMKPKKLSDIVAGQALFRPATLNNGDSATYMLRRSKKEPVPERHPDIVAETSDTYGLPIYQEQVIGLMRRIGMERDELTDMLDAVKASNESSQAAKVYLEQARGRVQELATARGWSEDEVNWLVQALVGYSEYSFNKAHAASYAKIAYRTAYLATHHPTEFWCGMLIAFQGKKRGKKNLERDYVSGARSNKVRVLPPHVNHSGWTYRLDRHRGAIRKGLVSIDKVGPITAQLIAQAAPFTDLTEMGQRLPTKVGGAKKLALGTAPELATGAITALFHAGALDDLSHAPSPKEST